MLVFAINRPLDGIQNSVATYHTVSKVWGSATLAKPTAVFLGESDELTGGAP